MLYRAFFALPTDLATASGQVTNAVYGFTSMLINLMQGPPPRPRGGGVRPAGAHVPPRMVAGYKAGRAEAPDILRQQMGLVRQVVETLHDPARRLRRATRPTTCWPPWPPEAADRGDDVIIVTGDRDTYQLVEDPHIKVLYNRRGVSDYVLYDEAGIEDRTGVTPASTRSTPPCAATRRTTCPACRESGRRRRPG